MSDNMMAIATTEAIAAIKSSGKTELTEVLSIAMDTTVDHWMCTNDNQRMLSAIAATMSFFGEDSKEYTRIQSELNAIKAISDAMSSKRFDDMLRILDEAKNSEPVGIMVLWRKAQERADDNRQSPPAEVS